VRCEHFRFDIAVKCGRSLPERTRDQSEEFRLLPEKHGKQYGDIVKKTRNQEGAVMKKGSLLLVAIVSVFMLSGCIGAVVGGAAVGGGTGAYFYVNGELKTDYPVSFDKAWNACEKTVAYMNATDVFPEKEISKGTIQAIIDGERVRFVVEYKTKDLTTVSIRVGIIGNKSASQRLHDKVAAYLSE